MCDDYENMISSVDDDRFKRQLGGVDPLEARECILATSSPRPCLVSYSSRETYGRGDKVVYFKINLINISSDSSRNSSYTSLPHDKYDKLFLYI